MAVEQGWRRRFPFLNLSPSDVERLIEPFSRGARVVEAVPLSGGLRNSNYRLRLEGQSEPVVLRVYSADASACAREAAIAALVGSRVPVAHVVHAEPNGDPPWSVLTFIDGARMDHDLAGADDRQVEAVARSAGRVLAAIHAFTFPVAGFFAPDLSIDYAIDGSNGWTSLFEEWLFRGRAGPRLGEDLATRLWRVVNENAWRVAGLATDPRLLHADYKPWNLLVRDCEVVGVLDWEFAFAGPPLNDIGIFLRHSRSLPTAYAIGFEAGYRGAGGVLPPDWRRLSRLIDLLSLCQFLERPEDDPAVLRDVRPLIEMTIDEFAP